MFSIFDFLNIYSLLACLVAFLWYKSRSAYSYWRKLNINYLEPAPFVGNTGKALFGLAPLHEVYEKIYKGFYNEPFGGIYQFRQPLLFVKDPELVTAVLIKDFKSFPNHGHKMMISNKDKKQDPLTTHLFFTEDERWKALRHKMGSVFSSGKLKHMYDEVLACVHLMAESIDEKMGGNDWVDLGVKEVCENLTIDVIGSCAFGLDCRSNEKFAILGREAFKPRLIVAVRMLLDSISKRLGDLLNVTVLKKEVNEFFINLALETTEYRRKNGITRNDLLQLLMELQNSHVDPKYAVGDKVEKLLPHEEFDELDIAANSFLFFVAGFETTASTLSFCFYELALNQNIQDKLRSEVERLKAENSKLTYDMLREMNYMDATVSETLRKYPPSQFLIRECVEDYLIRGSNIRIPAGTNVVIPVWSIQHDWKNYPNPEVFDPERFLGDNKHSRPSGTFVAFGEGPRQCLGKRFSEMEIKVALAEMILKYEIKPCAKTEIPLKFKKGVGMLQTTCGTWVSFVKRK